MFKRVGVLALMLSAAGAVFAPAAAFAQDRYGNGYGSYGGDRSYYSQRDRDWNRDQRHEWREHERMERLRAERREAEWREHERREHRRCYRDGDRQAYFYYGFGR